ncbi:MAG: EscU/YscU/HrcU family type III secretion system export apparatus switch protein [Acutalibacteraceae bacterium]|nr:type III secretion protein [Clostridiales bacterium]
MSQFDNKKAAALKYDGTNRAPVVVAAGSGYVAQKIVEVAQENDVPVYKDNSLATLLAQLQTGEEIPTELYQAIVDIYVYFLKYVTPESSNTQGNEISSSTQKAGVKQGSLMDISVDD